MAPIRIPRALKGLDIYCEDPSYWQKVLELDDTDFQQYAHNLYNIIRTRWPDRKMLNRFNKADMERVSAHLDSMVDKMSTYWRTTSGELDELLIVNVAFAFFLNDLDKYKEGPSKSSQDADAQNLSIQEKAFVAATERSSHSITGARAGETPPTFQQPISISIIYTLASYDGRQEPVVENLEPPTKRAKLVESPMSEGKMVDDMVTTYHSEGSEGAHASLASTPLYSILSHIENAKKRKRNPEEQ